MNYLAHAYLSFNQPGILAGNMISDYVKGKQQFDYPPTIQKGIRLHRQIDSYTDNHAVTQIAKQYFRKDYRLYAGAFIDVVYDHFLANDIVQFTNDAALKQFSANTYLLLDENEPLFPARFQQMFTYMKMQDWLYGYRFAEGMQHSFGGLVRRAAYLSDSSRAYELFLEHYDALQVCYNEFFPQLKAFTIHQLEKMASD